MAHVRKQIRDAAVTALTGLATTGSSVFASRTTALEEDELPALRVSTNDENVLNDDASINPVIERHLTLTVQACAKLNDTLDDKLDDMIQEVEVAMGGQLTVGTKVVFLQLTAINVDKSGDAEQDVGVAALDFEVRYYTQQGSPDVAI